MSSPAPVTAHFPEHELRLLVELLRLSRVTLLLAESHADKSAFVRSTLLPLLGQAAPEGTREVPVLFDAWDGAPLAALQARLQETLGDAAAPAAGGASLAASLRAWQDALGVTFLVIFDRFEDFLTQSAEGARIAEFEESFVEAAKEEGLRANFLLVLDERAEPLLARLRTRIPRLGNSLVRLPRPTLAPQEDEPPLELYRTPPEAEAPRVPARAEPRAHDPQRAAAHAEAARVGGETARKGESSIVAAAELIALRAQQEAAAVRTRAQPARAEPTAPVETPAASAPVAAAPVAAQAPQPAAAAEAPPATGRPTIEETAAAGRLTAEETPAAVRRMAEETPAAVRRTAAEMPAEGRPPETAIAPESAPPPPRSPVPAEARKTGMPRLAWAAVILAVVGAVIFMQYERGDDADRVAVAPPAEKPGAKAPPPASEKPAIAQAPVTAPAPPPPAANRAPEPAAKTPAAEKPAVAQAPAPAPPAPAAKAPPPPAEKPAVAQAPAPPAPAAKASPSPPAEKPVVAQAPAPPAPAKAPAVEKPAPPPPSDVAASKGVAQPARKPEAAPPKPAAEKPAPALAAAAPARAADATAGPALRIYVQSEAQRAKAERLVAALRDRGIQVTGISVAPRNAESAHIRYYDLNERNEAMRVAVALRDLGISAQQLRHVPAPDPAAAARRYELWLPAGER